MDKTPGYVKATVNDAVSSSTAAESFSIRDLGVFVLHWQPIALKDRVHLQLLTRW